MRIARILHPTDFSDCARRALQVAVSLAVSRATLHVFHARLLHAEDPAREEAELAQYLDDARFHARAWAEHEPSSTLEVQAEEVRGLDVFSAIMDEIDRIDPDLVVMGTHGRSGVGRLLMGSHTDKLLRHARCHVMTVRSDARLPVPGRGVQRILVPVDFSEPSKRALEVARSLARDTGAAITLTHVLSTVVPAHYAAMVASSFELDPKLLRGAERTLHNWAAGDEDTDILLTDGLPSMEITRMAAELEADLLVMGTRGLTGLEHVLVGSVTERVCRSAVAPVLVVK